MDKASLLRAQKLLVLEDDNNEQLVAGLGCNKKGNLTYMLQEWEDTKTQVKLVIIIIIGTTTSYTNYY